MYLYHRISVSDFVNALRKENGSCALFLPWEERVIAECRRSKEPYGLSLLRRAIRTYEQVKGIDEVTGKSQMPFFRQHQWRLVGPEMNVFTLSLYASDFPQRGDEPALCLAFDSQALTEYCIGENVFIYRCKYDESQVLNTWETALETEYDKVFFDAEHTGFAPDSRFVSLLYNAVLDVCPAEEAEREEWRMALFVAPEEVDYVWTEGRLKPTVSLPIPIDCLKEIKLCPDYREQPELYTALIGCMKQRGLAPERLLEGMIEDDEFC